MEKLVVIGGVAAGMSAAAKAKRVDPKLAVQVYAAGQYISYAGCGLPYFIGGFISNRDQLIARTPEAFKAQDIDVKTEHEVLKIDPKQQKVTVRNLITGQEFEDSFDRMVIATGASPLIPPLPGVDKEGVFPLRTINNAVDIRAYVLDNQVKNVVVVGGGFIGLEMVENFKHLGCNVTVVERGPQLLNVADEDMAGVVQDYLEKQGVKMALGVEMQGLVGNQAVKAVATDRGEIPADLVLLSLGVKPNSEIAAACGIETGIKGAIKVNEYSETNEPWIYAAGDCATVRHLISGRDTYVPMGTTANKQGKVAGENAAGGRVRFRGVVGTGIARILDLEFARTGLTEKECRELGFEYVAKKITGATKPGYCMGSAEVQVKLIAEAATGRILGGQIVGGANAGKRIDLLAVAAAVGHTVDEMADMDLAYSPPFSPVWDPILVALNQFS